MVVSNLNKISIYEWFQQIQGWHRLDVLVGLLGMCNPFELRFLAACVEDYAQSDYHTLHDQELKANCVSNIGDNFRQDGSNIDKSQVSLNLALLHSDNYLVADASTRVLDKILSTLDITTLISRQDNSINEYMLILTMASTHPAFRFEKKAKYREIFLKYEKIIYNASRRSKATRPQVEENCQYQPNYHPAQSSAYCLKSATVQSNNNNCREMFNCTTSSAVPYSTAAQTATCNVCKTPPTMGAPPQPNHTTFANSTSLPSSIVTINSLPSVTNNVVNHGIDTPDTSSHKSSEEDGNFSIEIIPDKNNFSGDTTPYQHVHIQKVNVTLEDKSKNSLSNCIQFMVSWSDNTKSEVWKTLPEVIQFCELLNQHKQKVQKGQRVPHTFDYGRKGNNRIHWKLIRLQQYFRQFQDLPDDDLSSEYVRDFFKHNSIQNDINFKLENTIKVEDQPDTMCLCNNTTLMNENNRQITENGTSSLQGDYEQLNNAGNCSTDSSFAVPDFKNRKISNDCRSRHSQYEFDTEEDIPADTQLSDSNCTVDSLKSLSQHSGLTFTFDYGNSDDHASFSDDCFKEMCSTPTAKSSITDMAANVDLPSNSNMNYLRYNAMYNVPLLPSTQQTNPNCGYIVPNYGPLAANDLPSFSEKNNYQNVHPPFRMNQPTVFTNTSSGRCSINQTSTSFSNAEPNIANIEQSCNKVLIYKTDNASLPCMPPPSNFINCQQPAFFSQQLPPGLPSQTMPANLRFRHPSYDGVPTHAKNTFHMPFMINQHTIGNQQPFYGKNVYSNSHRYAYQNRNVESESDDHSSAGEDFMRHKDGNHSRKCSSVDLSPTTSTFMHTPAHRTNQDSTSNNYCLQAPVSSFSDSNIYKNENMQPNNQGGLYPQHKYYTGDAPPRTMLPPCDGYPPRLSKQNGLFDKAVPSCYNCGNSGHTSNECTFGRTLKQAQFKQAKSSIKKYKSAVKEVDLNRAILEKENKMRKKTQENSSDW